MSRKPIKPVFLALALLALLNYLPLVAVAKDDPLHDGLKGRWSEAKCARVDENKKRRVSDALSPPSPPPLSSVLFSLR